MYITFCYRFIIFEFCGSVVSEFLFFVKFFVPVFLSYCHWEYVCFFCVLSVFKNVILHFMLLSIRRVFVCLSVNFFLNNLVYLHTQNWLFFDIVWDCCHGDAFYYWNNLRFFSTSCYSMWVYDCAKIDRS